MYPDNRFYFLPHFACSLWQEQQFGQPEHFPPQRDFPARLSFQSLLPARNKSRATANAIITVDIFTAFQKNRRTRFPQKAQRIILYLNSFGELCAFLIRSYKHIDDECKHKHRKDKPNNIHSAREQQTKLIDYQRHRIREQKKSIKTLFKSKL